MKKQKQKIERTAARIKSVPETREDRRIFALDDSKWLAFQNALDSPVQYKPRLARLLSEPGVLD